MTSTTTIGSDWRCDAFRSGDDHNGHRCDRPGSRYRDGQWVCTRCFGLTVIGYVSSG